MQIINDIIYYEKSIVATINAQIFNTFYVENKSFEEY